MKKEKIDKKKTGFSLLKKIMPNNSSEPRESLKFSEEKLKNEKTSLNADSSKIKISKNIQDNINYIKKLIGDDPTVKIREFHTKADTPIKCAAFFFGRPVGRHCDFRAIYKTVNIERRSCFG